MRLATVQNLLDSMGIGVNTGSQENAKRALSLSYPVIESILETKLEAGSHVDFFDYLYGLEFRLTNAFVDPDTIEVRVSESSAALLTATDGVLLTGSDYYLDSERGVVALRESPYKGKHTVSVTYDYGFNTLSGDDETLEVPQWLTEAGVAGALYVANLAPSVNSASSTKGLAYNKVRELRNLLTQHLYPRLRPRMTVDFPSRSYDSNG